MSGSALGAQRLRAEVASANLANAESTRTDEGGPYRRKQVVFSAVRDAALRYAGTSSGSAGVSGVQVSAVTTDTAEPIRRYEPSHPDADTNGMVSYPNINPVTEMADLMGAARSYQMNLASVQAAKQMIQQSIEILR